MQETQETRVRSLGREDPLEQEMATHSSILAWKSHGQRSLGRYSPWDRKDINFYIYMNSEPHNNNGYHYIKG